MKKCPKCGQDSNVKKKGISKTNHIIYVCTKQSQHDDRKKAYFYYDSKVILITEPLKIRYITCTKCKKKEYISFHSKDPKKLRYHCNNKKEHESNTKKIFSAKKNIEELTLKRLIRREQEKLETYMELYELYLGKSKRRKPIVDEKHMRYLEFYLSINISQELIAYLFNTTQPTLSRFIQKKKEENLLNPEIIFITTNKHINNNNLFMSKIAVREK